MMFENEAHEQCTLDDKKKETLISFRRELVNKLKKLGMDDIRAVWGGSGGADASSLQAPRRTSKYSNGTPRETTTKSTSNSVPRRNGSK